MIRNISQLPELIDMMEQGYVVRRRHPEFPLWIYNYTARAQYANVWNETTMTCRGLITDAAGDVVARPFKKFFNLEQVQQLPQEPFKIYEKMDGSLGILYWWNGIPYIATRGSFDSPQAILATNILRSRYMDALLSPFNTYLFEIIDPSNRIVVDYGDRSELVLLAIIDTRTGFEFPLQDIGFPIAQEHDLFGADTVSHATDKKYDVLSYYRAVNMPNREGFVVRFAGGLRVKIKMQEYLRLHKLLTGVNEKRIWECLSTGAGVDAMIERVPDEFHDWVKKTAESLQLQYAGIERRARNIFAATELEANESTTRKDYARVFSRSPLKSILFAMLDEKPYSHLIWRMIEPKNTAPFRMGEELE